MDKLVGEAIEWYLSAMEKGEETRPAAHSMRGILTQEEAEELRRETTRLREQWR